MWYLVLYFLCWGVVAGGVFAPAALILYLSNILVHIFLIQCCIKMLKCILPFIEKFHSFSSCQKVKTVLCYVKMFLKFSAFIQAELFLFTTFIQQASIDLKDCLRFISNSFGHFWSEILLNMILRQSQTIHRLLQAAVILMFLKATKWDRYKHRSFKNASACFMNLFVESTPL
jgi:hypothetical protein